MFKMLAHTPALALGVAGFLKPLMGDGALAAWYKELIALIATRVALLNKCEYCISSHSYLAKVRGASQAQVDAVDNFEAGPFTPREKLGFRAADRLHRSADEIDDAFYNPLQQTFSLQEIIELMATAAAFECFPRFVSSLHISTTPLPGEK
ncbi:MAG: carboxymuconolactone decarboxylase family protein [Candidatus Acidiferrales bacterium]